MYPSRVLPRRKVPRPRYPERDKGESTTQSRQTVQQDVSVEPVAGWRETYARRSGMGIRMTHSLQQRELGHRIELIMAAVEVQVIVMYCAPVAWPLLEDTGRQEVDERCWGSSWNGRFVSWRKGIQECLGDSLGPWALKHSCGIRYVLEYTIIHSTVIDADAIAEGSEAAGSSSSTNSSASAASTGLRGAISFLMSFLVM